MSNHDHVGIILSGRPSCTIWWRVNLYVNDVSQVTAVDMYLGGP
jgi:hypothetical protein